MVERKGDWYQTYTGKVFWVLDPRPEDIDIRDIAHALSLICRFGGHCNKFYSVAEHSILVHDIYIKLISTKEYEANPLPKEHRGKALMCALIHDAAEAYVGDFVRPMKMSIPLLKEIETPVQNAVLEKFGLAETMPLIKERVKEADNIALITEKRDVVAPGPGTYKEWSMEKQVEPTSTIIPFTQTSEAEDFFLRKFYQLQHYTESE